MFGNTPLHYSAKNGHLKIHELLMDTVEDPNPMNMAQNPETPLDFAKNYNRTAICKLIQSKIP